MDSQERVDAAFGRRKPDRTPVFEYCLLSDRILARALGRPAVELHWDAAVAELGWTGAVRQWARDRLDAADFFGHDLLYQTPAPPPPDACRPPPEADILEDDPEKRIEAANRRRASADPTPDSRTLFIYEALSEEMDRRKNRRPVIAPAYEHGVWTNTDLMETMLLAPEIALEHYRIATLRALALAAAYRKLGLGLFGVGGDFSGNRPLISPEAYRTFILPGLRELVDDIHAGGGRAINASDGDLWPVIDMFLIESGVDGYLEIDERAGMDLGRLKRVFGTKVTFLGNIDCGDLLTYGSPENIARSVRRCLDDGGESGHILTASNAIIDSVPLENYWALVNAYREHFRLPPLTT